MESKGEATPATESHAEPPHRPFQIAYETFFADLGAIMGETQRRYTEIHLEYQRAVQQAWQSQNLKELQEAHDNFRRSFESVATGTAHSERCAEAYRKYKGAIREAMASIDLEALDPTALSAIAQSLSIVANVTGQFCGPAPAGAAL